MADTKHVRIERVFDSPIALVWAMWTDEDHFANWYGPTGATVPHAEMDVQVGGRRLITMAFETPDGEMQMHFAGEYIEIEPTTRLVYTEFVADADGNVTGSEDMGMPEGTPTETRVTVELEDLGQQTRMVMTHVGVPADSPGGRGWEAALDKMQARLADHAGQ